MRTRASKALNKALSFTLGRYLGSVVSRALLLDMVRVSKPLIDQSRKTMQTSARLQYTSFFKNNLVDPPVLDRFTEDSWTGTLVKITVDGKPFDESQLAETLRRGDWWMRDAERGSLVDYSRRDKRLVGWARVDWEPPTCPFCTLLISRGPVYQSSSAASSEAGHYHVGDTCSVVLVRKGQEDSYEGKHLSDAAEKEYKKAAKHLQNSPHLDSIQAALKDLNPDSGFKKSNTDLAASKAFSDELDKTSKQLDAVSKQLTQLQSIKPEFDTSRQYVDQQIELRKQQLDKLKTKLSTLKGMS